MVLHKSVKMVVEGDCMWRERQFISVLKECFSFLPKENGKMQIRRMTGQT
jgi:hypothetical protein